MRNIEGLEVLSLFEVHAQNIRVCINSLFNGAPNKEGTLDTSTIPNIFESMERLNKLIEDLKVQINATISRNQNASKTNQSGE